MFENLIKVFKGKDFLTTVQTDFGVMLSNATEMFDLVCKRLLHKDPESPLKERIYALDKEINEMEKEIRRRILEHLSFNPKEDISLCLILMSIVKDAERVGDYSKNLYEVSRLIEKETDISNCPVLFDLEKEIKDLFVKTNEGFINSNEEVARSCWAAKTVINEKCDALIKELARSDRPANEAVNYALAARHFKRIASHLTNIATSMIVPLSDLDYFNKEAAE